MQVKFDVNADVGVNVKAKFEVTGKIKAKINIEAKAEVKVNIEVKKLKGDYGEEEGRKKETMNSEKGVAVSEEV